MLGEDHGRCIELGTALKNLSEYGKRHDGKVIYGTGETLPLPEEVKLICVRATEVRARRKGVGGEHSTNNNQDNKTCFREGSLLHSVHLKGGFCI